ncbi:MAG: OmpA family protein [Nevskia sp.]|nr:OmpA family protein [Nevskia sp.]
MRTHVCFALALLALASAAAAQDGTGGRSETSYISPDYIAVLPGYALPDRRRGTLRSGFTASGIYGYQFTDHFGVEANIQGSVFETGNTGGTDFYQWGATVDLTYSLFDRRKAPVTPFGLIGVGGMYQDVVPQTQSAGTFAPDAGIGLVTQPLYHGIRVRVEGRYLHDFYHYLGHYGFNDYRTLLGVEIPLGRVIERSVQAPSAPVEVKEVIKEVPRPWVDSDGDGVDDEHDLCPGTPKGLKVDAHGCVIPGQEIALNGVSFEFNKATLTANAETILDTVAPAFTGQPTLKVEIAGHTDGVGGAAANLKLSQRRAEAVRRYLISRGAKPEQLIARGYGKSRPLIKPERTAADRERNRRVEFHVLEK